MLTERERQMLELAARGMSAKQIGSAIGWSEATVRLEMHRLYRRIDVPNATGAACLAIKRGWIEGPT